MRNVVHRKTLTDPPCLLIPFRYGQLPHDDFRRQLLHRITRLRQWQFEGVCFLLDEAEFIVRQPWTTLPGATNTVFDTRQTEPPPAVHNLMPELLRQHDRNFAGWWNADQRSDGFGDSERAVYQALMGLRAETAENLAQRTVQSPLQTADALQVLVGTGVIRQVDDERYTIGARLFDEWVTQQRPAS